MSPREVEMNGCGAKSTAPTSHLPSDSSNKEILYDFTPDMSSTASTLSAQSDAFSDGSMLSLKSPARELPSSMELEDGILYDMRISSESESQSALVEVVVPKMTADYVPVSYTYVSSEEFEPLVSAA